MPKKVAMIVEVATGSKFAPEVEVTEYSVEEVLADSGLVIVYDLMKELNRTFHSDCNYLYRLVEDDGN